MKTILTLRTSSMFFIGSVNLYKGIPVEVNSEELSPSTIRIVNQAITSGRVQSTEGLLEVPAKKETVVEDTPARGENDNVLVVDESPVVEATETEPNVTEDETPAVVEAEVKAPVKKKTAPAKKKAE